MPKIKEMTGLKFGRLTVLSVSIEKRNSSSKFWNCICECGKTTVVNGCHLRTGRVKSCGCYKIEQNVKNNTRHGYNKRGNKHQLFSTYFHMKRRCENKNDKKFKHYGGRGIKICEEWKDITNFINWAENNGYEKGLTLDRIDNNGNYEPNNCRWSTYKQQNNNQSKNIMVGDTKLTLTQYCELHNINIATIRSRINRKKGISDLIPHDLKKRGYSINQLIEWGEANDARTENAATPEKCE